MRYFLVTAMLALTGGVQAAQAGSLTVPVVRVSPSVRVGPSVHPGIIVYGAGQGGGKTTSSVTSSMRKAGGDRGIIAIRKAGGDR